MLVTFGEPFYMDVKHGLSQVVWSKHKKLLKCGFCEDQTVWTELGQRGY